MSETISAKFVSKKIRKVRWKPRDGFGSPNPEFFISGSWDDKENEISLWCCPLNEQEIDPIHISSIPASCDVNDINFCDASTFLTAMGNGSVKLLKIQGQTIQEAHEWKAIHQYKVMKASCTTVIYQSQEVASVGEDGKLNLMRLNQERPYKTIEADSCSLNAAIFTSQTEILTGNSRGMLKLWDLRSTNAKPSLTTTLTEDSEVGVSSVDRHPFQGHIIAVGSYDGTLAVFDMRKAQTPITVLAGPDSCVNQVRFHPDKSDHLFTSSECGAVWHWSPLEKGAKTPLTNSAPTNVWLSGDLAAQQLDIKEVLPTIPLAMNSVDVSGDRLVCGGDNEALYYLQRVVL